MDPVTGRFGGKTDMERRRIAAEFVAALIVTAFSIPRKNTKRTWNQNARAAYKRLCTLSKKMLPKEAGKTLQKIANAVRIDLRIGADDSTADFGYIYELEFTARNLFGAGLISREQGRDVLLSTGGDTNDASMWRK